MVKCTQCVEYRDIKYELKELKKEIKKKNLKLEKYLGLQECGFCEIEMEGKHWPNCTFKKVLLLPSENVKIDTDFFSTTYWQ